MGTSNYLELDKVIFLPDKCRENVAEKARSIYGTREDIIIVDGRKEEHINWEVARQYENMIDESGETVFLHLGKPSSFEKCFAIPLRRVRGNNVICIHESYELQRRILLNTISSFISHENRQVFILADDNDSLFFKVKNELYRLCKKYPNLKVASDYGSICSDILHLEEEVISRRRFQKKDSIMVLWLGMENMMQEFAYYEILPEPKTKSGSEVSRKMQNIQDEIDNKFMTLFGEMESFVPEVKTQKQEDHLLYNATEKIVSLVKEGASKGIFQFVLFNSVLSLKFVKELKLENFGYKMSGYLNKDDCFEFYNSAKNMSSMNDQDDSVNMMLCYDKSKARFFLPYLVD